MVKKLQKTSLQAPQRPIRSGIWWSYFQENISFDHYFATYPVAANPPGEPHFLAKPGTPTVNGLTPDLMTRNQNSLQPQRLDRSQAATQDQNHDYPNEQEAMDHGLMDKFVEFTGTPESGDQPDRGHGLL